MTADDASPIEVVHLDDDLVVCVKPGGLAVHRGDLTTPDEPVLLQRLRDQLDRFLFPVHRLDKPTSGLIAFALNKPAAAALQQSLAAPTTVKQYLALARGDAPDAFTCDRPLRDEAGEPKPCRTEFETLARFAHCSLLRATLHTGRRHQIRRHLNHAAHHVLGDSTYGKGRINKRFRERYGLPRLFLHATHLAFAHPTSAAPLAFTAPLPDDLRAFVARLPDVPTDLVEAL